MLRYSRTATFCEILALLVENELFFPGWTASLDSSPERIAAQRIHGSFRGWRLPAGTYRMTARFRIRHLSLLLLISALSAAVYAALAAVAVLSSTRRC